MRTLTAVSRSLVSSHHKASIGTKVLRVWHSLELQILLTQPELFLPSYMDFDSSTLELRQDPVHDIVLTDEEAAAMLP